MAHLNLHWPERHRRSLLPQFVDVIVEFVFQFFVLFEWVFKIVDFIDFAVFDFVDLLV